MCKRNIPRTNYFISYRDTWYYFEVWGTISQYILGNDLSSVIYKCYWDKTAVKNPTKLKSGFVSRAWPNPISQTYKYSFNKFSSYLITCVLSLRAARLVNSQCTNKDTVSLLYVLDFRLCHEHATNIIVNTFFITQTNNPGKIWNVLYNNILHLFQLSVHIFVDNYLLRRSKFYYMLQPIQAILRHNTHTKEYISGIKCTTLYQRSAWKWPLSAERCWRHWYDK
jgi:hypothetical protein